MIQIALVAVHAIPMALACLFGVGFGDIATSAAANTAIQLGAPDSLRDRVMKVCTPVLAGSTPAGALFAGALAAEVGGSDLVQRRGAVSLSVVAVAHALARPWFATQTGRPEVG